MLLLLLPFLLFLLGIGVIGGWARRAIRDRFDRDLLVDAAGACLLLAAGAVWGMVQHDNAQANSVGVVLALIVSPLMFLVLGAFTLGGANRSVAAYAIYALLGVLLFTVLVFSLLVWFARSLPSVWSIA